MQTWWHRPHQMCQMKIQFERIVKPYSKNLIPIYIYLYLYIYICSEDLKSYPSQCSTIMVCILLHLSSVSQQPWEAVFQHQVRKNWPFEPVFFPAVCAWQATKYTFSFFFAAQQKARFVEFSAVGKPSEYQLFFSISSITFGVETRDRLRGVENSAKKSSGRKPFYSIAPRGGFFMSLCFGGTRVSGQWLCFFIGHDHSFAPIAEGTFLQTSVVCTHLLADDEGFLLQGVA